MKACLKVSAHRGRLAIDLPDAIAVALRLKEGDEVEVDIVRTMPEPVSHRRSLVSLRKYRGRLPVDFKFGRNDANRH